MSALHHALACPAVACLLLVHVCVGEEGLPVGRHPGAAAAYTPLPPSHSPPGLRAASKVHWGIHREAPLFVDQGVEQEILTTGIKVRACVCRAVVANL